MPARVLTPPTIRADAGPNKVVPTSQASDASGKLIYDRVGDKGQPERMVSREEQPADIKTAAPPPRVVLSSGMANPIAPLPSTPVPPSAPAFAAPPAAPAALRPTHRPSRKRSAPLTIRPDQPVAAETASTAPAAAPARAVPPRRDRCPPPRRCAPPAIRQRQAAQNDPNAPLSLTPNSSRNAARCVRRPRRQRSRSRRRRRSAYAVQVTSQRSEAEAQSSYQALQAKYPERPGQPPGGDPARRSRRQGNLLSRAGAVRQPGRGQRILRQPESRGRPMRRPEELDRAIPCPGPGERLIGADDGACVYHGTCRT